jgi:hypothetical protein
MLTEFLFDGGHRRAEGEPSKSKGYSTSISCSETCHKDAAYAKTSIVPDCLAPAINPARRHAMMRVFATTSIYYWNAR